MFPKNIGIVDRTVRVIVGVSLIAFYVLIPENPWHWLGLAGIVPLFTAAIGSCPFYTILGFSTRSPGTGDTGKARWPAR